MNKPETAGYSMYFFYVLSNIKFTLALLVHRSPTCSENDFKWGFFYYLTETLTSLAKSQNFFQLPVLYKGNHFSPYRTLWIYEVSFCYLSSFMDRINLFTNKFHNLTFLVFQYFIYKAILSFKSF